MDNINFFHTHKTIKAHIYINAAIHLPTQFVSNNCTYIVYIGHAENNALYTTCDKCDDRNDARDIIQYLYILYYTDTIKY